MINQYVDDGGRFFVLNTLIEDSPVVLINYYAPNEEKDQLKVLDDLNHILDNIDISEDTVLLWGGDFNLIFDIGLDADGGFPKLNPFTSAFDQPTDPILLNFPEVRNFLIAVVLNLFL